MSWMRRWGLKLTRALIISTLALIALTVALFVAINLPWTRSWIAREVSRRVSEPIAGTLAIGAIGHIGLGTVTGVEAELLDASGRSVARLSGGSADLDLSLLLRTWLSDEPATLAFERVEAARLEARLIEDASGGLSLSNAFEPERPSPETEAPTAAAAEPLRLDFEIAVEEAFIAYEAGSQVSRLHLRDLGASVTRTAKLLTFDLRHARVIAGQLPVVDQLEGTVSSAGEVVLGASSDVLSGLHLRVMFSGTAAEIPVELRAIYSEGRLDGFVDIEAQPPSVRRLWPDAAVDQPVHLYLGFRGRLDRLQVLSVLESNGGNAYVTGYASVLPPLSGELSLLAVGVNARHWWVGAPETSVELAAALSFSLQDEALGGRVAVRTWASRWEGRPLPDVALFARLEDGVLTGRLRAELPGAALAVRVEVPRLQPRSGELGRINVALDLSIQDLARLTDELALGELRGLGRLQGELELELGATPRLASARLHATLRQLLVSEVSVARVTLNASGDGPLSSPRFELTVGARRLEVDGYPLRLATLRARGGFDEVALQGRIVPRSGAPLRLTATVLPRDRVARDVALVVPEDGGRGGVRLFADRVALAPSGVDVRRAALSGAGRVELERLSIRGGALRVQGRTIAFSPVELARRLGVDAPLPPGLADVELDVTYGRGELSGEVQGSLTGVRLGDHMGRVDVIVAAAENVVDGELRACFPELWDLDVRAASLALPMPPRRARVSRVAGALELAGRLELESVRALLGLEDLELPRGEVHVRARLGSDRGAYPELTFALASYDLAWPGQPVAAAAGSAEASPLGSAPWRDLGVELVASITRSRANIVATLLDPAGASLAELQANSHIDVERLWTRPEAIDIRELPIEVELEVAERDLDDFPMFSGLRKLTGALRAKASAQGTVGRPLVTAEVGLSGLKLEDSDGAPLDITAKAELVGHRLAAMALVRGQDQKLLSVDAALAVSGGGRPFAIEQADVSVRSNGLPLEPLGVLVNLDVAGELFGALQIESLGTAPSVRGTLWVNGLVLRGVRQEQARLSVEASTEFLRTQLSLRQASGLARLTASGPLRWQDALVPALIAEEMAVVLEAKDFSLQALRPLLPEDVRALRGRLDANLALDPGARESKGYMRVRDGSVHVAALGQQFRDIELQAQLRPDGTLEIAQLTGRALQGRLDARGSARLDGLRFESAQLRAEIPKGDPLPFMFEGVTMAEAWGRFDVRAHLVTGAGGRRLNIDVEVPRLQAELPEQTPQDVQPLEADPTVITGTYLGTERFVSLPLPPYEDEGTAEPEPEPLVTRIEVTLGNGTWIERGNQLQAKLAGTVVFEIREQVLARGQIRIERGTLDVQGRIFQIEQGVITFVEDRPPSNPTVVATARYTVPEGTEVYAEFIGPVETGKLTLRSEPPLRDDQILSLLLFGAPDGNLGTSTGGDGLVGGAALAAGGSVVTRGLNQELRKLTYLDVQTRIGEREGEPQPEVVVQLSPRLTAELAYTLSAPTPGRAQDRTYLTLDLRLFRNWALSTTIGDAGSLLVDLLWRLRY